MVRINLKSTLWFLQHPSAYKDYLQKVYLAIKKRISRQKCPEDWCRSRAVEPKDLIQKVTGNYIDIHFPDVDDINAVLLYNLAEYLNATRVIETGVFKGESTVGLLTSLKERNGLLISTDIPLPEQWVEPGHAVPEELRDCWKLIRKPDRIALPQALKEMPEIDLCYYDSDKSYKGRMFAYPLLWNSLRKGGIFVSDDILDNYGFKDFCENLGLKPLIAKNKNKYLGLVIKNS